MRPNNEKDTRPTFLGGNYTSKVKGKSQVKGYLNKTKDFQNLTTKHSDKKKNLTLDDDDLADVQTQEYSISNYYHQKLIMKNKVEKMYKNQALQFN